MPPGRGGSEIDVIPRVGWISTSEGPSQEDSQFLSSALDAMTDKIRKTCLKSIKQELHPTFRTLTGQVSS
jgi:hypothetical protein